MERKQREKGISKLVRIKQRLSLPKGQQTASFNGGQVSSCFSVRTARFCNRILVGEGDWLRQGPR
jgi:hypothetical protein